MPIPIQRILALILPVREAKGPYTVEELEGPDNDIEEILARLARSGDAWLGRDGRIYLTWRGKEELLEEAARRPGLRTVIASTAVTA